MDRRLQFANVTTTIYRANGSGPTVLHRGQNILQSRKHSSLTLPYIFTILIATDIPWIYVATYCIAASKQRTIWMMEGEKRSWRLQMTIHLLYTESNNMVSHIKKNPFFHFYWHSPTVYKKYYTRIDQFTSLN